MAIISKASHIVARSSNLTLNTVRVEVLSLVYLSCVCVCVFAFRFRHSASKALCPGTKSLLMANQEEEDIYFNDDLVYDLHFDHVDCITTRSQSSKGSLLVISPMS